MGGFRTLLTMVDGKEGEIVGYVTDEEVAMGPHPGPPVGNPPLPATTRRPSAPPCACAFGLSIACGLALALVLSGRSTSRREMAAA